METIKPTHDRIRRMEFTENGFMYVRVERWDDARLVKISYFDPAVKRIVFKLFAYDGYQKGIEEVAKKVGRTCKFVG